MSCLQLQAKLVAVIEIVISTLALIFLGSFAVIFSTKRDAVMKIVEQYPDEHHHLEMLLQATIWQLISIFLPPVVYFVTEIVLGFILYHAAQKANHKRLRCWLITTLTLMGVGLIAFVSEVLRIDEALDIVIMYFVNLLFSLYAVWVVYSLISEIKAGGVHHPVPYHRSGFHKL